jgi:hypothetical protein
MLNIGEEFDNSFNIIHDESNTLEQSLDYFNKYTDPSEYEDYGRFR